VTIPDVTGGELNAVLARAIVRRHASFTGRGPARAQVFFHGNVVVVVLENAMTPGERSLVAGGRAEAALALRAEFLQSMRAELEAIVAQETGSEVVASLSDSHIDPDLTGIVFVLDQPVSG
jgi:uncharacterized protein YbcI